MLIWCLFLKLFNYIQKIILNKARNSNLIESKKKILKFKYLKYE